MTVLFGSVEYFEIELVTYFSKEELNHLTISQKLEVTFSTIKDDISHNFICSDTFREECLENLTEAFEKISSTMCVVN